MLRHVLIRTGFTTGEILVCLVINGKKVPKPTQLIELMINNIPGFTTLVLNINRDRTNVILGAQTRILYGPGVIYDYIGDLRFRISPTSFYQVNPIQTKVLYDTVLEFAGLTGEEIVIDSFCGIGTISLFLAQRAKFVYGVEIVSAAVSDARFNAKSNDILNAKFYNEPAETWLPNFCGRNSIMPDIIVLDPPSFSNSKKMTGNFDLQRDITGLLSRCLKLLAPKGKIFFSANMRQFKPEAAGFDAIPALCITNLENKITDEDFRAKKLPKSFLFEL